MKLKIILPILTISICYMSCLSLAGFARFPGVLDLAMTLEEAHQLIPVFNSFSEALQWSKTVSGKEEYITAMIINLQWLKQELRKADDKHKLGIRQQMSYCHMALIEQRKDMAQLGSVMYAGSSPQ
jgi:hypothetical protein